MSFVEELKKKYPDLTIENNNDGMGNSVYLRGKYKFGFSDEEQLTDENKQQIEQLIQKLR